MASLAEFYMKIVRKHYGEKEAREELEKIKKQGKKPYALPSLIKLKKGSIEYESCGLQIFSFNPKGKGPTVIYLHGGGYVHNPLIFHISFINKLTQRTDSNVIMPIYPLAPFGTYSYCYDKLFELYKTFQNPSDLIIMGDSSGGGLAIGFALFLKENNLPLPKKLVLFAPWVDLTMTNPDIPKYERVDPRNSRELARVWGAAWAGGEDLKNYKISPIYGDLNGLPPIVQYVGTRDLLYPDCVLFHEKLKKNNVDSTLITGNGLNHVYPVYPIPEARVALEQIAKDITN
ncbi:alpha/beta hydrolase [Histomonas meleagridis]|uniref:alpha/beta hydrolase n=1 Tax=Histomonas meleagridis TaxID=135588 RepID=UPI00355A5682|nr:alpha/beta hydrolase [Histomonas meleagridis]